MTDKLGVFGLGRGLDAAMPAAPFTRFGRWSQDAVFFVYMRYIQVESELTCLS
jgi:hypothetical protein